MNAPAVWRLWLPPACHSLSCTVFPGLVDEEDRVEVKSLFSRYRKDMLRTETAKIVRKPVEMNINEKLVGGPKNDLGKRAFSGTLCLEVTKKFSSKTSREEKKGGISDSFSC